MKPLVGVSGALKSGMDSTLDGWYFSAERPRAQFGFSVDT